LDLQGRAIHRSRNVPGWVVRLEHPRADLLEHAGEGLAVELVLGREVMKQRRLADPERAAMSPMLAPE